MGKGEAPVGSSVVGQDASSPDTELAVVGKGPFKEAGGGGAVLILEHFDVGHPGGIVDTDVDKLPASILSRTLPVAGNAVSHALDAAKLLHVEVKHVPRPCPLVAPDERYGVEGP